MSTSAGALTVTPSSHRASCGGPAAGPEWWNLRGAEGNAKSTAPSEKVRLLVGHLFADIRRIFRLKVFDTLSYVFGHFWRTFLKAGAWIYALTLMH